MITKHNTTPLNNKGGVLYLVPTPIGNLADMTYRGVQVLNEVDIIYAEDTRTSNVLLKHYDIKTPLKSYHKFNEKKRCDEIVAKLNNNKNIAIISDAGTPGISDPSNIIVRAVIEAGFQVSALPGATALIPALVASGFDTNQFYMVGFLPNKKKEKIEIFKRLISLDTIIVFYESPHRLFSFLMELKEYFKNADICIVREISKVYETFYRGKLDDLLSDFNDIVLKGEFVVILRVIKQAVDYHDMILKLYKEKYHDLSIKKASEQIAIELNVSKNKVYEVLTKR